VANLLYLVHRLPYPPDKGDKVRSYHLLKHLCARHTVYLGTFVDDPADEQHVSRLREMCADVHAVRVNPRSAKVHSLGGLLNGRALTLHYYQDAGLARWVKSIVEGQHIDAAVVFSSSMAQYAEAYPRLPMLVDFVDVDSAKWTHYAGTHRWPLSWLYKREGIQLLAYERSIAAQAARSFFVTAKEAELFCSLAPECASVVESMGNGVDTDYFSPEPSRPSPFATDELPLVFTGAMDYWPNVDAAVWFAREVFPPLLADWPTLRLHIVGRSPTAAVLALASDVVKVSGTVADVRPYLQHAALAVAPLRIARGLQNKILEAMAMARPVVASTACVDVIDAQEGVDLLAATSPDDFVRQVGRLLRSPATARDIGAAARQRVLKGYSWDAHLATLDRHLPVDLAERVAA
jgi:sugar transferase (PEP-CTERM/EpsH1 system associated)